MPPEAAARGRAAAAETEAIEWMAASKRGVPAHPNTRAALLAAAKAPKLEGWGEHANRWMQEAKGDDGA